MTDKYRSLPGEEIILKAIGKKACSLSEIREKTKRRFGGLSKTTDIMSMVKKLREAGILKRYWTPDGVPRYFRS